MAYFPNGSDTRLEDECEDCLHADPEIGCPIVFVHLMFNYDQCNNNLLRECLTILFDDKEGCKMKPFIMKLKKHERFKQDKETMEIFKQHSEFN